MSNAHFLSTIINSIAEATSQQEKAIILSKYSKESLLKRIIKISYNPWVNLNLQNFVPSHMGKQFGMGIAKFIHIIDDIIEKKLDHKEAEFSCKMAFIHITTDEAPILLKLINQTLDDYLGLEVDTINSIWDNFIVTYPISQPASTFDVEQFDAFPAAVQTYSTGLRVNIIVNENQAHMRLKNGTVFENFDIWLHQFVTLAQGQATVFDGHAVVIDSNNNIIETENEKVFEADPANVRFILWDAIRYDGFINGEDTRIGYNWRYNGIEHMMMLALDKIDKPVYDVARAELVGSTEQLVETLKSKDTAVVKSLASTWKHGIAKDEYIYKVTE